MERTDVLSLLEGRITPEPGGAAPRRFTLIPTTEKIDPENGSLVWTFGEPCDRRPTRCVLLLGETGAGKTTLINAMVNHLFGVQFEDDLVLQVVKEDGPKETESQTNKITVYKIYHQKGIKYEYNFVLIDTPGLGDTRGQHQQEKVIDKLEIFLASGFGEDEMNCIGLVTKASTNKDLSLQKALLDKIIALLGGNVPQSTYLLATFAPAVYSTTVDAVVKNAGIAFNNMYKFDNGILVTSQRNNKADRNALSWMWNETQRQYEMFFKDICEHLPPVSVTLMNEEARLAKLKNNMKIQVEILLNLVVKTKRCELKLRECKDRADKNRQWKEKEPTIKKVMIKLAAGAHAHNCLHCLQTCIFPCPPSEDSDHTGQSQAIGAAAAAAPVAADAAAAAAAQVVPGIAAAAAPPPVAALAAVAAPVTPGIGAAAATVVAPVAAGVVAGLAVAFGAKALYAKYCADEACRKASSGDTCPNKRCPHSPTEHEKQNTIIKEREEHKITVNEEMKKAYCLAMSEVEDVKKVIAANKKNMFFCQKDIAQSILQVLDHAQKVQEEKKLRRESQSMQYPSFPGWNDKRLSPLHPAHRVKTSLQITKEAIKKVTPYGFDGALCESVIQEMFASMLH